MNDSSTDPEKPSKAAAKKKSPAKKAAAKKAAAKKAPAKKAAAKKAAAPAAIEPAKKKIARKAAATKPEGSAPASPPVAQQPAPQPSAPPVARNPEPNFQDQRPARPEREQRDFRPNQPRPEGQSPGAPQQPTGDGGGNRGGGGQHQQHPHQQRPHDQRNDRFEGRGKKFGKWKRRRHGRGGGGGGDRPPQQQPGEPANPGAEGEFSEPELGPDGQPLPGQNGQHGKFQRYPRPERKPEPPPGPPEPVEGLLEISGKGFGFLRLKEMNYVQSPTDTFVTPEMVRQYGLREGVWIEGEVRRGHRGPQLTEIKKVNGRPPDQYRTLPMFEELTAINPNKRYLLETDAKRFTTRLVDMVAPIGRGQRGLIVAAPRAGKTTFLEHIAQAIMKNYDTVKLIVLLVDERPEEVTELTRALPGAEIMASSNDQQARDHIRMAQLAVERAKRLVEAGEHVFMLLDSITRLARAYNVSIRGGGKAMSGGIDSRALEIPRKIFAAARNTREAGSLTIIATALTDTNQKGDNLIFQEFKGTGNMELVLDRSIAQQYIYPAIDIFKSGTRREELLLPPYQLEKINVIRRGLAGHKPVEAVERLLHFMERHPNNAEMLMGIPNKG